MMFNVCLAALATATGILTSPMDHSTMALYFRQRYYLVQQYTPRPGPEADYAFILGERVQLNIEVWNESDRALQLETDGLRPETLFDVVLIRKQNDVQHEVPVRLTSIGSLRIEGHGTAVDQGWPGPFELSPRSGVVVPLEIQSVATREPGYYELRLRAVRGACEPDCHIRNQAGLFRFEIRDSSTLDARVELLTRQAWSAVMSARVSDADRALQDLLALYPQSVFGHQLRGELADKRNQPDVAATEYSIALQILVRREDSIYVQIHPDDVDGRMAGLRGLINSANAKRSK